MKLKQFEDFQLYVRENDWGFWQNSEYEPEETKLIKSLVKPSDVCLDIGANIGYFTVLMAKLGYSVHAFEPEPTNYDLLEQNVKLNKLKNVILWNDAVVASRQMGKQQLYLCSASHGMHRMFKSKFCDKKIEVDAMSIDNIMQCKIDFVKIDVEGSELDVIDGMYETIKKYKPTMVIEFHPPTIEEKGDNPKDEYDFLTNLGYDIRLVPNIDQTISYEDLYKETMKEPSGRNILCLPQ